MKPSSKPIFLFLLILTLILILFLSQNSLVQAVENFFETCRVPNYCGNQTISFPFYIKDVQEQSCGQPGFQISCLNDKSQPILNLSGEDYLIHNIFYENQSIIVSNLAFSRYYSDRNHGRKCNFPKVQNLSLAFDQRFAPVTDESKVFLLYGCESSSFSSSTDQRIERVGCYEENGTNSAVLALAEAGQLASNVSRECEATVVESAAMTMNHGNNDLGESLRRGFLLKWIAPDCTFCNSSSGKCGFDFKTRHFKCYCPDRPHAARCDIDNKKNNNKRKLGLGLGLGIPLGALIVLVIGFFLRRHLCAKKRKALLTRNITDPYLNPDPETGNDYYGIPLFPYKDLQEATNNFDTDKELGDGGFGAVYHGVLKDGREVAVKRLYEHNYKRLEQFVNEIKILTRLRHRNLVTLYGCTSRRSRELLLVYEYVPNGTVADHLHGDRAHSSPLHWPARLSLAIETASALAYLHASDVVHRDVKTTNILLDNDFRVKVADFGLSRLFPDNVTHVSTAPQGTPGYVDPEYHQCYQLTSKSDVYSFGVVLIELISSMPAVDITRHRHEINLSNMAVTKISKRAYGELVDPLLKFDADEVARRAIIAVAELAFLCLQQDRETRPTMEEVLEELKRIEGGGEAVSRPPPSPECDDICLLKTNKEETPSSPNGVTENWPSSISTTPNVSS